MAVLPRDEAIYPLHAREAEKVERGLVFKHLGVGDAFEVEPS